MSVFDKDWPIKLSVPMAAYNQERYIEQAIASVLMQKTRFFFEIVIGEDCSKDRTREILQRLAAEDPQRIRLTLNEKNLGMHGNYRATYDRCRGQYLAILEGDDYWLDEHKLQKQVDFLDAHPQCVLCFHDVLVFDESGEHEHLYCPAGLKEITGLNDIVQEMFINTTSVVMRNGPGYPPWGTDLAFGDWPYFIYLATFGDFGYLPDVMAAYRKHAGGAWSKATPQQQIEAVTKMYQYMIKFLDPAHEPLINAMIKRWTAYFLLDGERRDWKERAKSAEAKVEELNKARRDLKTQVAVLKHQLEQLHDSSAADQQP